MLYSFTVTFKDGQELNIIDINDFGDVQINEIRTIACRGTQKQIKAQKYGKDIKSIERKHKETVLIQKNDIVQSISSDELHEKGIVKISLHAIQRTFQRVGSIGRLTYIDLIDRIKGTDTVTKGQWKGYPHLSYTFLKEEDPEAFTFSLAFLLKEHGKHKIKMITIFHAGNEGRTERMESRLLDDPKNKTVFEKLEKLFNDS